MSVSVGADNLNYLSKFNNQTVNRLLHALSSKDPLGCSPEDVLAVLPRPAGAVQSESTAELSSTLDSAKATTRRDREKRRHEDVEAPAKAGSNKRKAVAKHNARHILPPDSDMHPSGDSLASEMDFDRRWFDPQADALRSLGPDFPSSEFEFGFGDALLDDVPFSPAKSARTRGQYRGGFFSSPRPAPSSPMVPGPTFRSSESASSDPHQHLPSSVSAQITVDLLDAAILPEWSVPSAPGSLPSTAAAPANGIEPTALPAFSQDTVAWSQSFDSVVQLPTIPSILLLKSSQYLPIEDVIPNESKKSSETTTGAEPTPSAQISDVLDTNSPVSTSVDHGQYDAPLDQTVVLDDAHTPAAAAAAREREDFSELCRDVFTLFSLPRRARGKVLCDEDKVHTAAEEVGLILSSGSFRTQQVRLFSASSVSKLLGKPTQRRRISDIFAFLETLDMIEQDPISRYWKTRKDYRERLLALLSSLHREAGVTYPGFRPAGASHTPPVATAPTDGPLVPATSPNTTGKATLFNDSSESDLRRCTKELIKIYLLSPPYVTAELVESMWTERGVTLSSKMRRLLRYIIVMLYEITLTDSCKIENIYVIKALKTSTWGKLIPWDEIVKSHSQ